MKNLPVLLRNLKKNRFSLCYTHLKTKVAIKQGSCFGFILAVVLVYVPPNVVT